MADPEETSKPKMKPEESVIVKSEEIKYFQCKSCNLKEPYEYFGNTPPFSRQFKLLENAYVIEDPFLPPKQGEFIILGAHCIKCGRSVCKDPNCSIFYIGTYCIDCARCKNHNKDFPKSVQDKISRVVPP